MVTITEISETGRVGLGAGSILHMSVWMTLGYTHLEFMSKIKAKYNNLEILSRKHRNKH